jgi:hypothetical protein
MYLTVLVEIVGGNTGASIIDWPVKWSDMRLHREFSPYQNQGRRSRAAES